MVKSSSDGSSMIASGDWINLPVGENLYDHVGVSWTWHLRRLPSY